MGGSIAAALGDGGLRTVTVLAGRSARTRATAEAAGVTAVDSPAALVRESDVVLSVVPPAAAVDVAETVASGVRTAGERVPFVDLNAIAPGTAREIDEAVLPDVDVVDGCLVGPARDLTDVTVFLSGAAADDQGWLERYGLDTVILGDRVGQASGLKLCYAGMTKATSVVGMDLLLAAVALDVDGPLVALYRERLTGLVPFLDGRLPGNPKRAGRRADEMAALASMLEAHDISGEVFRASHERLRWLDALGLDTDDAGSALATARRVFEATRGPAEAG